MYRLVAVDMDGTLLNRAKEVSTENQQAIAEARQKGVRVVLCSGRPYQGLKPYLNQLGICGENEYAIGYNGGMICTAEGQVLSRKVLGTDACAELEAVADELGLAFQIVSDGTNYVTQKHIHPYTVMHSYQNHMALTVLEKGQYPYKLLVDKIMLVGEPEELDRARGKLPPELFKKYTVTRSCPYYLEFLHMQANKGDAVRALADMLALSSEEIVCIGDEENDLSMLRYAGLGVAMANAAQRIQTQADLVSLYSNEEDGVAHVLRTLVL